MSALFKLLVSLPLVLLLSCDKTAPVAMPSPQELTRDALGYYCLMTVVEHKGPKGQIILSDAEQPLWFTSVRDTIAFTILPGEPKNIAAIYVTDMGRANWDMPEAGTWIDGRRAWYVIGSERSGGMGAPEVVPFGKREDAEQFISHYGGHIVDFKSIPEDQVLGEPSAK